MWGRISDSWKSDSTLRHWPTMPKPPPEYWTTYRNFIRKAFCSNLNHRAWKVHLKLDTELGAWYDVTRHIPHQYIRTRHHIYTKENNRYVKHTRSIIRRVWKRHSIRDTMPTQAHPIHAMSNEDGIHTRQKYNIILQQPDTGVEYSQKMHSREDIAGSDGTADPITGDRACASVIHFDGIRYLMRQRHTATCDATSYRAELEGIYGVLK